MTSDNTAYANVVIQADENTFSEVVGTIRIKSTVLEKIECGDVVLVFALLQTENDEKKKAVYAYPTFLPRRFA